MPSTVLNARIEKKQKSLLSESFVLVVLGDFPGVSVPERMVSEPVEIGIHLTPF